MTKRNKVLTITALAAVIAIGFFLYKNFWVESPEDIAEKEVFTIGAVTVLQSTISEDQAFVDHVAANLSQYGIKGGEVVSRPTVIEMGDLFNEGKIDIAVDTPFPAFIFKKLSGAVPILNRWREGEEKYRSIIFTRKDSGINNLDDLKGKIIAFQNDTSTSAYFLPKAELLKRGYKLTLKKGPNDSVSPDEIGYYFTETDPKIFEDVRDGVSVAGAQNEGEFLRLAGGSSLQYKTLLESIYVFRNIMVVSKDMPEAMRKDLKAMLLDLDKTSEGKAILYSFRKTSKFTDVGPDPEKAFKEIEELATYIEDEIIRQR